jgi:hypothetical protein
MRRMEDNYALIKPLVTRVTVDLVKTCEKKKVEKKDKKKKKKVPGFKLASALD